MNYKNKKAAVITGAAGFIGSNLARKLLSKKITVHAFIKKETNLWRLNDLSKKINFHVINLSEISKLKKAFADINPNFIFHLAVRGAYPSQTNVKEIIETNITSTFNLLEATKDIPYECFVNTGSSSEYGFKDKPMKETDLLRPISFYAVTKAASSLFCTTYAKQYNKPIVTFRLFSVYGPYEEPTRLIPVAMKTAIKGGVLKLTKGNEHRDFVYIEDVLDAYLRVVNKKNINGEIFNIGTGKQYTNIDVAKIIKNYSKNKLKVEIGTYKSRSWDTDFWVADISKTKRLLNWKPKYTLEKGLKKTYQWFNKNLHRY